MKSAQALCLIFTLVFFNKSFAFDSGFVTVTGTVQSFDESAVILQSKSARYKVPRRSVLLSEIKSGQLLSVELTKKEFDSVETSKIK